MTPDISFIVPTRGRVERLRAMLTSVVETASRPDLLEVVLVIDQDDVATKDFDFAGVEICKIVTPTGGTMGELNRTGYAASTGRYVMLMNDDVVVRTKGWDETALSCFRQFPDEIALVHVNDTIFEQRLCTFPFVSRVFCDLMGEICPPVYRRYRIDDDIYNIFNLLAILGHRRITYLPDVVFEHGNKSEGKSGVQAYTPIEEILALDAEYFDAHLGDRKEKAKRLAQYIDEFRARGKEETRSSKLGQVSDSYSIRLSEYVRVAPEPERPRVTVGVVTANRDSDHARTCLDLLKKYTVNFDLVLLDNNRSSGFNHAHEMNKIISIAATDYLVLMDDDVFVEPGWLERLMAHMGPDVGVVTPVHKDREGKLSYGGVVLGSAGTGRHSHILSPPDSVRLTPTICSAVMLISLIKCGHVHLNEVYRKYFLDLDYGLRIWEAGYKTVCAGDVTVTHIGGATLAYGSELSDALAEQDRVQFVADWISSGRLKTLEEGIWQTIPDISHIMELTNSLPRLAQGPDGRSASEYQSEATALLTELKSFPILLQDFSNLAAAKLLAMTLGESGQPLLIDEYQGYSIVLCGKYHALPLRDGPFDIARLASGDYTTIFSADTLEGLKARIDHDLPERRGTAPTPWWQLPFRALAVLVKAGPVGLREEMRRYFRWMLARAL